MTGPLIGWGSALIGMPTFGIQTCWQWQERHSPASAASLGFFAMALVGTAGQLAYSWMVRNPAFLTVNAFLVANNAIGLGIAVYRSRIPAEESPHPT